MYGLIPKPGRVEDNGERDYEIQRWEEDELAKSDIILSIVPSQVKILCDCATSNEIWRKLHTIHESKEPTRKEHY